MLEKPKKAYDIEFVDENQGQGWAFGCPVGISSEQWPRSQVTGTPMVHLFTVLVPEEYRVKSKNLIAFSLFQANDVYGFEVEGVKEVINNLTVINDNNAKDFWSSLNNYANNRHPQEVFLEDLIGDGWALIWLTEEEFNGQPTPIPRMEANVYPREGKELSYNDYDKDRPAKYFTQIVRIDDPNVGKLLEEYPNEDDENAYIPMYSKKGKTLNLERFHAKNHFGGTANPIQGTPDFSPFYFEFEENLGDSNMGGGNGQIDLLNEEIDWACD